MKCTLCLLLNFALLLTSSQATGEETYHQVGVAPNGQVAFEYIGVVKQEGFLFKTFGFFTYIRNVPDDMLFFDSYNRDQTQARFTFHSESRMKRRSIVNNVFNLGIEGDIVVYYRQDPVDQASMDDDKAFAVGESIATMTMRGQSIITTIAPDSGVNSATIEAEQTRQNWKGFSEAEKNYTFGRPKSRFRFAHTGHGTRTQKEPLIATITIAGHAISVASSDGDQ